MLPVDGKPLVAHVLEAALDSRLDSVALVLGHRAQEIRKALGDTIRVPKLRVIENRAYRQGISTSIAAGLAETADSYDHVMILLADMPYITAGLIDQLISEYLASGAALGAVSIKGRRAHPVIFGRALYDDLRKLKGDVGARELFSIYEGRVCLVEVGDSFNDRDIDTPEDYNIFINGP